MWWKALLRADNVTESLRNLNRASVSCGFGYSTGDSWDAIWAALTFRFLDAHGVKWTAIVPNEDPVPSIDLAIYGGGGILDESCISFTKSHIEKGTRVLLFPLEVRGNEDFLASLPASVILFCRDNVSFSYAFTHATGGATVRIDHDVILHTNPNHFVSRPLDSNHPTLWCELWNEDLRGGDFRHTLPLSAELLQLHTKELFSCSPFTPRDSLEAETQRILSKLSQASVFRSDSVRVAGTAAALGIRDVYLHGLPLGTSASYFETSKFVHSLLNLILHCTTFV